jgi:2-polyprenyl-3-methyl-5-hydroxy-6-metoxy-1,4-benzoquinol methylase
MDITQLKQLFTLREDTQAWSGHQQFADFQHESSQQRYSEWKNHAVAHDLYPIEYLLPRICVECPPDYPAFMLDEQHHANYSIQELQRQIDALAPWGFHFRLREGVITNDNAVARNRIVCRSHLITSTVEKLLGEKIARADVLDMGCHSGFFSLDIASRGVHRVIGVELRQSNLMQAQFLADYYRISNVEFTQADVMSYQPGRTFNVVLNLGLLYHVTTPIELVNKTYELCEQFAVIDTICHKEPISAFITSFHKDTSRDAEGKFTVELHPTYRALIDTMYHAGFKQLVEVVGTGGRVSGLYETHERRCIIGFK